MERWRTVAWGPECEGEGPGRCPCDTLDTCFLQTPPGRSETHQGEAIAGESPLRRSARQGSTGELV